MKVRNNILVFIFFLFIFKVVNATGENRLELIRQKLDALQLSSSGLTNKIDVSVSSIDIRQFLRSLANTNHLNIDVDNNLSINISINLTNVIVKDVLIYLCKQYELDLDITGNILNIYVFHEPYIPQSADIKFDKQNSFLGFDLKSDSLTNVVRQISILSGKNVLYHPMLANKLMNGFVLSLPFQNALEKLAIMNDLKLTLTNDSVFIFEPYDAPPNLNVSNKIEKNTNTNRKIGITSIPIKVNEQNLISLNVNNTSIQDLIAAVSGKMNINYFLLGDVTGNTSLSLDHVSYDQFLFFVMNGTAYSYKKDSSIYLIGDKLSEALRKTQVVQLINRTVDKVIDYIPESLKKNLEIKTFTDQNSLVINGSEPDIANLYSFIKSIDVLVPVITIEVIIADIRNSRTVSTGLEAGLGQKKGSTSGVVYPSVDMSLNSNSINNLIDGLNGFGSINLGKVTPNFYINIKALEEQGNLNLRSTPQLATLNGNEATLSIGKTEYYLETSNNVIGTQNPQNIITQQYKSVNADLSIVINPIVSGDQQITLTIDVRQSSFTERISPSAPPGTITRNFKSLIRVKNDEMILLGGLEEDNKDDSGSGLPILSRLPILKWLFSSRNNSKSKNKLAIFIKPNVLY